MNEVWIIRFADTSAHEGDDGIFGVYANKIDADKACATVNEWERSQRRTMRFIDYYVEKWEVE